MKKMFKANQQAEKKEKKQKVVEEIADFGDMKVKMITYFPEQPSTEKKTTNQK